MVCADVADGYVPARELGGRVCADATSPDSSATAQRAMEVGFRNNLFILAIAVPGCFARQPSADRLRYLRRR